MFIFQICYIILVFQNLQELYLLYILVFCLPSNIVLSGYLIKNISQLENVEKYRNFIICLVWLTFSGILSFSSLLVISGNKDIGRDEMAIIMFSEVTNFYFTIFWIYLIVKFAITWRSTKTKVVVIKTEKLNQSIAVTSVGNNNNESNTLNLSMFRPTEKVTE